MKLIGNIVITGFLSLGISMFSFLVLLFLFQDVLNEGILFWFLGGFFSILTIGISLFCLFLPIVLFNKKEIHGLHNWMSSYLPIALVPIVLLIIAIVLGAPEAFNEREFTLVFINCMISFYTSFIIFFKSNK